MIDTIKEKLIELWETLSQKSDEDGMAEMGRERIIVFFVAFVLAFFLWLMVNLSRSYNLNVNFPIRLGGMPENQAMIQKLPAKAKVSVSGEGWKLINLYNNPPSVDIDVADSKINLYAQVQQKMNSLPDIGVQKVKPAELTVDLEKRVSKKVPIKSQITVSFKDQYDFVGNHSITPDSITVSGAQSLVENIKYWSTDSVAIKEVSKDLSKRVSLQKSGSLLILSQPSVQYNANVAQFTEGETKVRINTQGLPTGGTFAYSPAVVRVKYEVPIVEYANVEADKFTAYVPYQQILQNSSGFVTPIIEYKDPDEHLKIRSHTPRRIAYFKKLYEDIGD